MTKSIVFVLWKQFGSLAKSCVEILNFLCIIVHNQKKMKMIRAFCTFNDFMLLSLWKRVFNSLHHKLIRLKPFIFLENRALCAKIAFGIKYFMRISAILAALLHFRKRASHVVGMGLYTILLNACIYKRVYIKYIIRLIRAFALYFP